MFRYRGTEQRKAEAPRAPGSAPGVASFHPPAPANRAKSGLPPEIERLAAREREIASIVHMRGEMSAEEVRTAAESPLSNSAVRTMLNRLTAKGLLRKHKIGKKFVYLPADPGEYAREAALKRLSQDYFDGSPLDAARALLALIEARQAAAGEVLRFRETRLSR
jgi:predicted transcriptional regulator